MDVALPAADIVTVMKDGEVVVEATPDRIEDDPVVQSIYLGRRPLMLEIRDLHVRFGRAHILQGVSLSVGARPLAIVGRNGMGKTTLCQAVMGLVAASEGEIALRGERLSGLAPFRIARRGIALVPQGRRTFPSLSVDEHLRLVASARRALDAWSASTRPSRAWRSAAATAAPSFRAGSSRCWPSPAPC